MKMDDQYIWESLTASPVSITVTESDNVGYGCLMVFLDDESASEIRTFARDNIPEEFLDEFGFEDEPHITCQYGFHGSVTVDEITEFIQTIDTPIKVALGDITRFTQDAYDVIKMDIISKDLHDLSDKIRKHFKETLEVAFPEYQPHMTLAYVKKVSYLTSMLIICFRVRTMFLTSLFTLLRTWKKNTILIKIHK
tara:strand:+ start:751 stop:1335 length:585 start_codon:yes stop_codon:yes gene_type:complete